jgi:hypothetical protein
MPNLKCPCGAELEPRTGYQTPEQKFCGDWYDHPQTSDMSMIGHVTTTLVPSKALIEQHA